MLPERPAEPEQSAWNLQVDLEVCAAAAAPASSVCGNPLLTIVETMEPDNGEDEESGEDQGRSPHPDERQDRRCCVPGATCGWEEAMAPALQALEERLMDEIARTAIGLTEMVAHVSRENAMAYVQQLQSFGCDLDKKWLRAKADLATLSLAVQDLKCEMDTGLERKAESCALDRTVLDLKAELSTLLRESEENRTKQENTNDALTTLHEAVLAISGSLDTAEGAAELSERTKPPSQSDDVAEQLLGAQGSQLQSNASTADSEADADSDHLDHRLASRLHVEALCRRLDDTTVLLREAVVSASQWMHLQDSDCGDALGRSIVEVARIMSLDPLVRHAPRGPVPSGKPQLVERRAHVQSTEAYGSQRPALMQPDMPDSSPGVPRRSGFPRPLPPQQLDGEGAAVFHGARGPARDPPEAAPALPQKRAGSAGASPWATTAPKDTEYLGESPWRWL